MEEEYSTKGLQCPVCFEFFKLPIQLCIGGHSFCNICRNRLSMCPLCKLSFINGRNYSLEEVISTLALPCKYRSKGCIQLLLLADKEEHEKHGCDFKDFVCISCKGTVGADVFIKHCSSCESIPFIVNQDGKQLNEKQPNGNVVVYRQMLSLDINKGDKIYLNNIKPHGQFVGMYTRRGDLWFIRFGILKCKQIANKFFFKIELLDKDETGISYSGQVCSMQEDIIDITENGFYCVVQHKFLLKIRNIRGGRNACPIKLSIIKKEV